ncbi:MAG: hypothetical protein M3Y87_19030 [Myxococcota bacterium]|nr:hypothetical protein [Myxococcota bacterium]
MRHSLILMGALTGALALTGCAVETAASADPAALAEGVTVLEAGEGSLSIAFRQGDDVFFAEVLRGRPAAYPDEPDMPAFEIDARFTGDDGAAFYSRQGGDDLIDPSWGEALQAQSDEPASRESNEHLFMLAGASADLLREGIIAQLGEERAAELTPEIDVLVQSATDLPRAYREGRDSRLQHLRDFEGLQIDAETGDVAYGTSGGEDEASRAFGGNYYNVAVHKKCIFLCAGDHSATRINEWLGYWAHAHDFCNHGECASGMGRDGQLQYTEPVGSDYRPTWTAQTCGTGYDWDSGSSGHNCHDDSRMQMNNFVYNRTLSRSGYWCADSSTNKWKAPDANGDDDGGYNHPSFCQYDMGGASSCPSSYQGTGDGCDCGCRFPDGTHADPDCRP